MTTTQAVLSQPESAPSGATRRHSFETSTPDPLDKSAVAFISGPLDATDAYFESHYRRRIDAAIASGHSFVVGPVMGIDTLALEYVLSRIVDPQRVTVYMAFFEYANPQLKRHFENMGVQTKCVGDVTATTRDRDAKMTEDSGYDILRYRTEEEAKALYGTGWWPRVSNTEMNERRRKGITSQAYHLNEGAVAEVASRHTQEESLYEKEAGKQGKAKGDLKDRLTRFLRKNGEH